MGSRRSPGLAGVGGGVQGVLGLPRLTERPGPHIAARPAVYIRIQTAPASGWVESTDQKKKEIGALLGRKGAPL